MTDDPSGVPRPAPHPPRTLDDFCRIIARMRELEREGGEIVRRGEAEAAQLRARLSAVEARVHADLKFVQEEISTLMGYLHHFEEEHPEQVEIRIPGGERTGAFGAFIWRFRASESLKE